MTHRQPPALTATSEEAAWLKHISAQLDELLSRGEPAPLPDGVVELVEPARSPEAAPQHSPQGAASGRARSRTRAGKATA